MIAEARFFDDPQRELSGFNLSYPEVISCEEGAFWELLQERDQLPVSHDDYFAVQRHVLNVFQDFDGTLGRTHDFRLAHIRVGPRQTVCNL